MFDLDSEHQRHTPEPDLVPILDALTSVIFFLLLSTTFFELTKLTLPPSQTSVITDPQRPTPVAAKMMIAVKKSSGQTPDQLRIVLKWGGEKPDVMEAVVERNKENARDEKLESEIARLVTEFNEKYPTEKSIQLGFGTGATYQEMITSMDGVRAKLQDVVLFSNLEVDALLRN